MSAAHHSVPFFIAAPTTTLDANLATGAEIEIEQRPPEEITHFKGQRVVVDGIGVSLKGVGWGCDGMCSKGRVCVCGWAVMRNPPTLHPSHTAQCFTAGLWSRLGMNGAHRSASCCTDPL